MDDPGLHEQHHSTFLDLAIPIWPGTRVVVGGKAPLGASNRMRIRGSESINRPVAMLVTNVRPPVSQKVKLFKRFNSFVALCQETRELLSRGGYPTSRLGVVA